MDIKNLFVPLKGEKKARISVSLNGDSVDYEDLEKMTFQNLKYFRVEIFDREVEMGYFRDTEFSEFNVNCRVIHTNYDENASALKFLEDFYSLCESIFQGKL